MSGVGEVEKGCLKAIGMVLVGSMGAFLLTRILPAPNPDLLNGLASLGTGLLLAYVIEAAWITPRMRTAKDFENRLGVLVGVAVSGLFGVVIALLLAAHRAAGHSNWLDHLGLAWTVVSLAILGGLVVLQPLLVHEWQPAEEGSAAE